ncbi:hypothetical protein HYH03_001693 [Edaphochlamys debaryana]|uniref:Uncharacterized protein n=1 Tax=Edaphochlamys debaryana TaxID=47281 RepID=A0A836C4F7_9CHLO|nr:hypothetical protein HYH03_001693 [Edaphochlamys debaryana]|eukprot:KAG2500111.1 hypothetical protein HYH03_001693 [Edaphochlamys debaryana]
MPAGAAAASAGRRPTGGGAAQAPGAAHALSPPPSHGSQPPPPTLDAWTPLPRPPVSSPHRDAQGPNCSAPAPLRPTGAAAGAAAGVGGNPAGETAAQQGTATATTPVPSTSVSSSAAWDSELAELAVSARAPKSAAAREPKLTPAERVVEWRDLKKGLAVVCEGPGGEHLAELGVGHVIAIGSSLEEGEWAVVWWLQGMHNVQHTCYVGRLPGSDPPRREYWLLFADEDDEGH